MNTQQDFLNSLFSRSPVGSLLEFRAIGGDANVRRTFWRVENLSELEVPDPGDANLVFGVLPGKRRSGKARDVVIGTCLWIDLDGPPIS